MKGYGLGLNLDHLLKNYWKRQRIFPKGGKCLKIAFVVGRGVKQGDTTSPMIFNIMVDAVVWAMLDVVYSQQESQHDMGCAAGERILVFYADDGRIVGRYHEWIQDALTVTVVMFSRMGLDANLKKTKVMVCTPGFIWGDWGETAYKRWATGEGANFRERKRTWVSCNKCIVTVEASYLKANMARIYGICIPKMRGG